MQRQVDVRRSRAAARRSCSWARAAEHRRCGAADGCRSKRSTCPPDRGRRGRHRATHPDQGYAAAGRHGRWRVHGANRAARAAERIKAASYGVIVWAPARPRLPQCRSRRASDLRAREGSERDPALRRPVARRQRRGSHGGVRSAPGRRAIRCASATQSGKPEYDPDALPDSDACWPPKRRRLLWSGCRRFTADLAPPATDIPTIVLGTPGLKLAQRARRLHSGRHARHRSHRPARPLRQRRVAAAAEISAASQACRAPPTCSPPSKPLSESSKIIAPC